MEKKVHFKLHKVKKHWVTIAVTGLALGLSFAGFSYALAEEQPTPVNEATVEAIIKEGAVDVEAPATSETTAKPTENTPATASSEAATVSEKPVASSEVASETDRSATSEVTEVRGTDREAVDTSLRTVLTNSSQPGVDGPVTADGSLDIPSNGTYYFRRTTEIRTAPIMDIKPTFVFSAGDHVIYDKVLKRDNHQWISYIGYDYERYYADIAALKAENTSSNTEATRDETIPERGTYYFTKPADVKNQPSLTAKTEFNFDPGMSVNYDRSLLADNHRWISYVSYNGTRRYVDLGAAAEAVAKPRGDIAIESHDNGDFSVVISNVLDQNGVLGVSVPIWSEKNGQDDIIWYNATRLNNGNYKVNVSLTDHKNERGLYNVHLYYVETNGKLVGVGGTTYTVPAKLKKLIQLLAIAFLMQELTPSKNVLASRQNLVWQVQSSLLRCMACQSTTTRLSVVMVTNGFLTSATMATAVM